MCCKSWYFWVGLLGLCIVGAILRTPDHCRAQPSPAQLSPTVIQEKIQFRGGAADKGGPLENPPPPVEKQDPAKQVPGTKRPNVTTNVAIVMNPKAPAEPVFKDTAEGYGEKDDDATKDAIDEACRKVAKFMAATYGETEYTPTPEEMKSKQIVGSPLFETKDFDKAGRMQKAIVEIKLSPDAAKDLREEARKQRVTGRMKTAGMALAGLISLLLVGGGYLRLEEATKGYYTALLRMTALGILGFVAATLIYFIRVGY